MSRRLLKHTHTQRRIFKYAQDARSSYLTLLSPYAQYGYTYYQMSKTNEMAAIANELDSNRSTAGGSPPSASSSPQK